MQWNKKGGRLLIRHTIFNMLKRKPEQWRIGQTIFNFLEWLKQAKYINGDQSGRLADTFYISDKDMEKYYNEYLATLHV